MKTKIQTVDWLVNYAELKLNTIADKGGDTELSSLGADSLEAVTLIVALEEWLDIELCPNLLWDCSTLNDVASMALTGERHEDLPNGSQADYCIDSAPNVENVHPYKKYVNPYLAHKLEQLDLDKQFVTGAGCYLYDSEGVGYLDFMAQYGALPFGHNPPKIWEAIMDVAARSEPSMIQPSLSDAAGELAERLVSLAPNSLSRVTFANSGAESVEVAIKLCLRATGRPGILSTHGGFHGKTLGALSASGRTEYQSPFGLPLANFERVEFGDIEQLRHILVQKPDQFAAFIVEPIQGEGGVIIPPPEYLQQVRLLCSQYGVLLVADEVQTGLGRTGYLFASEQANMLPDVITLAKALGGGLMPVAAVLCSEKIYSKSFAMKHSSTFAGNALAMRAGIATLKMLEEDNSRLLKNVRHNGNYLKRRLQDIQKRFPLIIQAIHGEGYMIGIRFGIGREHWPENFLGVAAEQNQLSQIVAAYLLNVEGLRVAPTLNQGAVLRVQPPLTATKEQCTQAANAIERCIEVLATGDTGRFFGSLMDRKVRAVDRTIMHSMRNTPRPEANDTRFAFLVHPLDDSSFVDFDLSLNSMNETDLHEFVASMDGNSEPFIASSVRIQSPTGSSSFGEFVLVPHTTEAMLSMPREEVVEVLSKSVAYARDRGAQLVGLGAYTSILSSGGLDLVCQDIPLTSGNSLTAVAGVDALDFAVKKLDRSWSNSTAAIIGAAGSIGRATAVLMAEKVSKLILIGNPKRGAELGRLNLISTACGVVKHLINNDQSCVIGDYIRQLGISFNSKNNEQAYSGAVAKLELSGHLVLTTTRSVLRDADLIVTATSVPGAVFDVNDLKSGAIVCDQSRPRSVTREIVAQRPDVLVIDGGLIEIPGRPYIGPYGLEKGFAYACMAETMLLALEGHLENCSLGLTLNISETMYLRRLARRHKFYIATLQSFSRPLTESDWERVSHSNMGIERLLKSPAA